MRVGTRCAYFLVLVLALAVGPGARAQDVCADAIRTVKNFNSMSKMDRVRFGLSLTQESWFEYQNSLGLGAFLPIGDVPVSLSANWAEASKAQELLKQQYKFSDNFSEQGTWIEEKIAEGAYGAYETCILQKAAGLNAMLVKVQGSSITGEWFFRSASGDREVRKVKVRLSSNAKFSTDGDNGEWPAVASGDPPSQFTVARTGAGNINIRVEILGKDGKVQQSKQLPTIVQPPRLSVATFATDKQQVKSEDFNAEYTLTTGHKSECFLPQTEGGKIVAITGVISDWKTGGEDVHIPGAIVQINNQLPYTRPSTGEVCLDGGCTGYSYRDGTPRANCSGKFTATAVERYIQKWTDSPDNIEAPSAPDRASLETRKRLTAKGNALFSTTSTTP